MKPLKSSKLPKYVYPQHITKKSGKTYTYYRFRRDGKAVRIYGEPGTPEFHAAYAKLLEGTKAKQGRYLQGTVAHTVQAYITSPEFLQLAPSTQKNYKMHLFRVDKAFGDWEMTDITRGLVLKMRDKKADTPVGANHLVIALSQLFKYAVAREICENNPATGIPKLKSKGTGNRMWTDDEIASFRANAPAMMRLAMEIGLYTGQRISDVRRLLWADYDGSAIKLRQQKTGTPLVIPIHRDLKPHLDAAKKIGPTILTSKTGLPFHERVFFANFKAALKGSEVEGVTFHGLRHTAASKLAEVGCTTEEIQAITGHKSLKLVEHYTKGASQKTLADAAILKFEGTGKAQKC